MKLDSDQVDKTGVAVGGVIGALIGIGSGYSIAGIGAAILVGGLGAVIGCMLGILVVVSTRGLIEALPELLKRGAALAVWALVAWIIFKTWGRY